MSRLAYLCLCVIGLGSSATALVAPSSPTITGTLVSGGVAVSGTGQTADASYSSVAIYVCTATVAPAAATDCSSTPATLTTGGSNSISTAANGTFTANLQSALKSASWVWVTQVATPSAAGAPAIVTMSSPQLVAAAKAPTIIQPVTDGQNPITGQATASTAATPVQVQLYVASSTSGPTPRGSPEIVGLDGSYTLHETVAEGELVQVKQVGGTGDGSICDPVLVLASSNEREHIDFFAGTVISQNESNFAQADTFLALNVDRALKLPGWYQFPRTNRMGMNGFFQARLTTIPVNASTTTTTTSSSGNGATTGGTPAAPTFSSVLTSQKTGHFEAGIYFPRMFGITPGRKFVGGKVVLPKQTQTFYFAPVARFGFNTLATSQQTTTTNSNGATTTSTPTQLGTSNPLPTTYNFFVLGARIGTASIGSGSLHNIHYLDVALGKFSNLENLLCKTGAGQCTSVGQENRYRPWRLSFEGYYEIPTGFIVGMSANVGAGFLDNHSNTDIHNRAASDLRFLFGYKFDVNKLFKALPMISQ